MKPRNVKELIGYVVDKLSEDGIGGVYAVFNRPPHAVVADRGSEWAITLWRDGVKLYITLRKDTLEPVSVKMET